MPIPVKYFLPVVATESNNTAILSAIRDLGCKHIITSPIEHHAVLHTVEHYDHTGWIDQQLCKITAQWTC